MSKNVVCTRCVMDNTVPGIYFSENGECNYCTEFLDRNEKFIRTSQDEKLRQLEELVGKIKKEGQGKPYDCVVGISGGLDSSWVLVKAIELGLRPLAVQMDNGWNSELAQSNISNLVNKLNIDLETYVINWNEYKSLMQAFFDADVIDVELLYDNAMTAVNYNMAKKYKTKYILTGSNTATEGFKMPVGWNWFKKDKKNIFGISSKFSKHKVKSFPSIGVMGHLYLTYVKGIKWIPFPDYFKFDSESALNMLESNYSYRRYPYKHYESIFTRFYQGYILPEKFSVDKRKLHLSNLVVTEQMRRDDALVLLENNPYASEIDLKNDIEYFLKKMGWSPEELENYLKRPEVSHLNYPSEKPLWDLILKTNRLLKKLIG